MTKLYSCPCSLSDCLLFACENSKQPIRDTDLYSYVISMKFLVQSHSSLEWGKWSKRRVTSVSLASKKQSNLQLGKVWYMWVLAKYENNELGLSPPLATPSHSIHRHFFDRIVKWDLKWSDSHLAALEKPVLMIKDIERKTLININ